MGLKWMLSAGFLCLISAAAAGLPESQKAANDAHQAILTEGWHTGPAEATQLESQLASHPQDVGARVRLISHYYQEMIAEPRAHHILWLIENHPEAEIFQIASDVTSLEVTWHGLNSAADQDKARALWLRQLERFSRKTAHERFKDAVRVLYEFVTTENLDIPVTKTAQPSGMPKWRRPKNFWATR